MRRYLFTLLLFLSQFSLLLSIDRPGNSKTVTAHRLNEKILLDGLLSETVWTNKPISEFTQSDPKEGEKATELTEVWVAYDDDALYVAAKLYDSQPDSIVGLYARRDDMPESDIFAFAVDSYFDRRTAFVFALNPAGSMLDGTFYNDSWNEWSWDGIWDYGIHKNSKGWYVEMRIPFTQLRFKDEDEMKWGINFYRRIHRKNEEAHFVQVPKKESGYVSHFATLIGLRGIKSKQRLELLPYFVSKAQYLIHDADDPFYKGKQYRLNAGADLKLGLGSNLTLDATFNPDFGQVEVDPAVVNLSAFETFYQEKRPFFIEGGNIFRFGSGGANSNWGMNWGDPRLFYSRRIGRAPQGSVERDGFVDYPTETRILGAAKLSGKIGDNLSLGIINAVTERTFATIDSSNFKSEEEVEPLTYYGVFRAQKEFNSGSQSIGMIGTAVIRDLEYLPLKDRLSDKAFTLGIDGWTSLDSSQTYVVTSYLAGSYSHGSENYLVRLQRSSRRYLQRPDAAFLKIDSNLTSLSGYVGRVAVNKQKGNIIFNSAVGILSPGFESNDLGFQSRADVINAHVVSGYRWYEPDNFSRSKSAVLAYFRNYNFDGDVIGQGILNFGNIQFLNYWGLGYNVGYNFSAYSTDLTRGGPITKRPNSLFLNLHGYTDGRKKLTAFFGGEYFENNAGDNGFGINLDFNWKPSSKLIISFGPSLNKNFETAQWAGRFEDKYADETYGNRYVFGEMKQTTISSNIRLNWTFTPKLSLQLYLQPLISVGNYENFKELAKPRTYDFNYFGENGSTIKYDSNSEEYTVDPDGIGPAVSFSFQNPDFNYKSLRANLVLRWEFSPGSAFYFVWTHDKTNFDDPGRFSAGRDFKNLWNAEANNILMIKFSYWLDV